LLLTPELKADEEEGLEAAPFFVLAREAN